MRQFFDNFAKSRGFNPLDPQLWYSVGRFNIFNSGGVSLLHHFGGSYMRALIVAYPELNLKLQNFSNFTDNNWKNPMHRRQFFDQFASANGFDPLVALNWYSIRLTEVAKSVSFMILNNF